MIRKPTPRFEQESAVVANLRTVAASLQAATPQVAAAARAGGYYVRGIVCWGLAILWGFVALVAGVFLQFPTFLGVGAMAAVTAWIGTRMFAKARGCRSPGPSRDASRHTVDQPWEERATAARPADRPCPPDPTIARDGRQPLPSIERQPQPEAVRTPRAILFLIAGVVAVLSPLIYAGPQLASDLTVGKDWTIAPDLAVKQSKCTRWYFLVSTCAVDYVNRLDPARPGDTLNYLALGSWAGERALLLRSAKEPNRIGSTLGVEHMRQRLVTFGIFVALALAYAAGLIRFLGKTKHAHEPVVRSVAIEPPAVRTSARCFGRRTTGVAEPV